MKLFARWSRRPNAAKGRVFGIAVPGVPDDLTELEQLTEVLGRSPSLVTWYAAWSADLDFPAEGAAGIAGTGAIPEV
jgi:hypothetical protein